MKGGSGYSCMHLKIQNRSTFPSDRKVITSKRNKEERKLTDENNGFFSLPETRTETNPRANSIGFETIEINLVLIH